MPTSRRLLGNPEILLFFIYHIFTECWKGVVGYFIQCGQVVPSEEVTSYLKRLEEEPTVGKNKFEGLEVGVCRLLCVPGPAGAAGVVGLGRVTVGAES